MSTILHAAFYNLFICIRTLEDKEVK